MVQAEQKVDEKWNDLPPLQKIEDWDVDLIRDIFKSYRSEKSAEYQHIIKEFQERANGVSTYSEADGKRDRLLAFLTRLQQFSSFLTEDHSSLVNSILRCEWCDSSATEFSEYFKFISGVLTAQPSFVDSCLRVWVKRLRSIPFEPKPNFDRDSFGEVDEKTKSYFDKIMSLLGRAIQIVPLSMPKLLKYLIEAAPFKLRPEEEHFFYTYNLLQLHRRQPTSRSAIITILVEYIAKIDAEASPQELNELALDDEDDDEENDHEDEQDQTSRPVSWIIEHPTVERLDLILTLVFEYIDSLATHEEGNSSQLRSFYQDSLPVFDNIVFKSNGLTHVQFLWFYLASLQEKIAEDFLQRVMQKITTANIPTVFRQYAACYASSYLARAKFDPVKIVIRFVDQMAQWIHDYITEHDTAPNMIDRENIHRVFYAVCQNCFYLLTFRHREIFSQQKGLIWFRTLNFERIITCKLNPFKYCQKVVMELFATVTRQYNLLFCYTVIERNNRLAIFSGPKTATDEINEANPLNTFFPFEPYVLKRSKRFILSKYRTYDEPVTVEGAPEDIKYRGLIADSEESEESRDSDTVEELLEKRHTIRLSRKRHLSENNPESRAKF